MRLQKLWFLLPILAMAMLGCAVNSNRPVQTDLESPIVAPGPAQPIKLELTSPGDGLANLQSYRAKATVDFAGTRNGQPVQGRLESLTEVTRQPAALHQSLQVETPQPGLTPGPAEFYRVGDKVYVKRGTAEQWLTFSNGDVSPEALGFFKLEDLITLPASVSRPPQPEILDGWPVQHYRFSAGDLAAPNLIFEQAQGGLWLAAPDGFLAQYAISATVRVVIPDPQAHLFDQGSFTLHYTLKDINAPFDLIPPQSVLTRRHPLSSLPRLPDAQIISVFPTFIEYTSAISPVSATLFYRDELTAQGWTEDNLTVFNEKARLSYSKEGEALTVLINLAEEAGKIKVLLDLKP